MSIARRLGTQMGPAVLALVLTIPTLVHAQTTSASVSGPVQDSQGGVLPGVTVTLTSRTQGNALTAVTDEGGRFVFPIVRPDTYVAASRAPGLQDTRAHERRRERERQAVDRHADARSRPDDGGSQRLEPRHRAAVDERRALVHARKRGAEEHRQQRPHALQLRDAGAGRCPERLGRQRDRVGQRLHRERPAAELQQHHD